MSFGSNLRSVLVATDGSPSAAEAVDFAVELAADRHGYEPTVVERSCS